MAGVKGLRVAFCHPDLGLGGAERLVVDAATELASGGAAVDVWTAYYDPARCFEETRGSGGFAVRVAGGWFPRSVAGRCIAICAYVRCCLVALAIVWRCWTARAYDVVVADQVSVVVPLLLALTNARVVFYCHFPDQLLSSPASALHRAYRAPLNWLEQATTGMATRVLVNSEYTAGVFAATFNRLHAHGIRPGVLYPAVAVPSEKDLRSAADSWAAGMGSEWADFLSGGPVFLSINRFERKKGLALALRALAELRAERGDADGAGPRLVMAGGYDKRLPENVEHLAELQAEAADLGLGPDAVRFLPSFTDEQRAWLLAACTAVLYTPEREHFGIVPLEAMAAARPVVACNSGGPCESIGAAGDVGFLCDPTPGAFAAAMRTLLAPNKAAALGVAARRRVQERFSRPAFGARLGAIVSEAAEGASTIQMAPLSPDADNTT